MHCILKQGCTGVGDHFSQRLLLLPNFEYFGQIFLATGTSRWTNCGDQESHCLVDSPNLTTLCLITFPEQNFTTIFYDHFRLGSYQIKSKISQKTSWKLEIEQAEPFVGVPGLVE